MESKVYESKKEEYLAILTFALEIGRVNQDSYLKALVRSLEQFINRQELDVFDIDRSIKASSNIKSSYKSRDQVLRELAELILRPDWAFDEHCSYADKEAMLRCIWGVQKKGVFKSGRTALKNRAEDFCIFENQMTSIEE